VTQAIATHFRQHPGSMRLTNRPIRPLRNRGLPIWRRQPLTYAENQQLGRPSTCGGGVTTRHQDQPPVPEAERQGTHPEHHHDIVPLHRENAPLTHRATISGSNTGSCVSVRPLSLSASYCHAVDELGCCTARHTPCAACRFKAGSPSRYACIGRAQATRPGITAAGLVAVVLCGAASRVSMHPGTSQAPAGQRRSPRSHLVRWGPRQPVRSCRPPAAPDKAL